MSEFMHERFVDPITGRSKLTVSLEGRVCIQVPLHGPIARSYVGFVSIVKDLEDALCWIQAAHELLPPKSSLQSAVATVYSELDANSRASLKAYFFAAITLYGRCFVSASGRGTSLTADAHVAPVFLTAHERIMGYRHGLVAHAGSEFDEGEAIVALAPPDHRFHVAANIWRMDFEDDRECDPDFQALIAHVRARAHDRQGQLLQKLIDGPGLAVALAHHAT